MDDENNPTIQLGLGENFANGEWQKFAVNLTEKLQQASGFEDYQVHKVDSVEIFASFEIDDIRLSYRQDRTANLLDLLHWTGARTW